MSFTPHDRGVPKEKFEKALNLLDRAAEHFEHDAPDATWFQEWFLLTGQHMICTEEGWQPGSCKADLVREYGKEYILDEVNAPPECSPYHNIPCRVVGDEEDLLIDV